MDDDMKAQIADTMAGKRRKTGETTDVNAEIQQFETFNDGGEKRRNKENQKSDELRAKYDKAKENEQKRKYSKSAFLTPESVKYLNTLIK